MTNSALQDAIQIVGGQAALAKKIGVTQSTLWYWLDGRSKKGVPAEYVLAIEAATEKRITRQALRPDLYPAGEAAE